MLEGLPQAVSPDKDPQELSTTDQMRCRKETVLWTAVTKCAWSAGLFQLVLDTSLRALQMQWTPSLDSEMVFIQVSSVAQQFTSHHWG